MFPQNENRNEGTFAKTTPLRNRPFDMCPGDLHSGNVVVIHSLSSVWRKGNKIPIENKHFTLEGGEGGVAL